MLRWGYAIWEEYDKAGSVFDREEVDIEGGISQEVTAD
jgi:hypothetical protein